MAGDWERENKAFICTHRENKEEMLITAVFLTSAISHVL